MVWAYLLSMTNDTRTEQTPRLHWTEAQMWRARSGKVLPAGALLTQYRADLRGCPSLCCATFSVFCGGESWERVKV